MSQAENPQRLLSGRELTIEDIHELTGPPTPAFALQLRERVRRRSPRCPPDIRVRSEGERAISDLERLAFRFDDPRGAIGLGEEAWRQPRERTRGIAPRLPRPEQLHPSAAKIWGPWFRRGAVRSRRRQNDARNARGRSHMRRTGPTERWRPIEAAADFTHSACRNLVAVVTYFS